MTTERASEIACRLTSAFIERAKEHDLLQVEPEERKEYCTKLGEAFAAMYKAIFAMVIESRD